MMLSFSTLTFAVHKGLEDAGVRLSRGHVQQLVAAAAGYGSLAAFQAAEHPKDFDAIPFWVVDVATINERAEALDAGAVVTDVVDLLDQCMSRTSIYGSVDAFASLMQENVERWTFDNGRVSSELAMLNGDLREVYMPLELWDGLDFDDEDDYVEKIYGQVTLTPHPDRMNWGTEVKVEATLRLPRLGKCFFDDAQFEINDARANFFDSDDDDDEEQHKESGPSITLAAALADALGLDNADTEGLDFEQSFDGSDDGHPFSLILDFSETASGEVAKRIRAKHPDMKVYVQPEHFSNVRTMPDGEMF